MFTASHAVSHLRLSCYIPNSYRLDRTHPSGGLCMSEKNLGWFVCKTDKTTCKGPKSLNTQIKTSVDFFFCCKHHNFLSSWGHFCVMWFIHTPLTPVMPLHLWICSDKYPCQALLLSNAWVLRKHPIKLHATISHADFCRHTLESHIYNAYKLALWADYLNSWNK